MCSTNVCLRAAALAAGLLVARASHSSAQTATQVVTFRVDPIDQIAVQGTPVLTMTSASAGGLPTSVSATGSTWSVTTNRSGARVTASLESPMPDGLTLSLELTAPDGATSMGLKALGTTSVDVVTNLSKASAASLPLRYRLDAVPVSGIVRAGTRVVLFTITGGI